MPSADQATPTAEGAAIGELRFDGRVAVVTGAGRGLGRAYALLLAARGAKVVVNDTSATVTGLAPAPDQDVARQVVSEIAAAGGQAVASTDSVATEQGGDAIIQTALDVFGRVDVLIHNAGNARFAPLKEMSQTDFDAVLDVHLRGAFHLVRPAFPLMCRQGYGRVVLTSSIAGLYGNSRVANYATAKAGMIGLSNTIALEGAAEGVNSNVILPGALTRRADGLDTSAYPSTMDPGTVAPVVAYLAHEACKVTGELWISMAGRVARAFIAESAGVYRPDWTIEAVADEVEAIRSAADPIVFPTLTGFADHLKHSFRMASAGVSTAAP